MIAGCYRRMKHVDRAYKIYEQIIQIDENNLEAL